MEIYRPTRALIDLGAIERNTRRIIEKYNGYKYYTAVVKADCYGYKGFDVVRAMIDGGANFLAASLLEEGVALRQEFPEISIMLFNPVDKENLHIMKENNLICTVATPSQAEDCSDMDGLKVMIRANGGSDILGGPTDRETFHKIWNTLKNGACALEGIYLHSYNAEDEGDTEKEYKIFEDITSGLDIASLPIVSVSNSLSLPRYSKKPYCNTCRLGNIIYKIESDDESLENTFSLVTRVLDTFTLKSAQSLAYGHAYVSERDNTRIASVPIGFGDGFSKTNIGRDVFINGRRYPIVAITMDISHVLIDETINKGDEVLLIKDTHHLEEISNHIHGATEEAICALGNRVPRIYIK